MALLAYLLLVASLLTSAFVGYEWVATSSMPRVGVYAPERAKIVRQANRAKLASAAKARQAAADEGAHAGDATVVSSTNEPAQSQRVVHVRPKHLRVAAKRPNGMTADASLGFGTGFAPTFGPAFGRQDRD